MHPARLCLAVCLAAALAASAPVLAAPEAAAPASTSERREVALPPAVMVTGLDPEARTVTIQEAQKYELKWATGVDGRPNLAPLARRGEPREVPLAANVSIVRVEGPLPVGRLTRGDSVHLIGAQLPFLVEGGATEPRAMAQAEGLTVVSLSPLTLRVGAQPDQAPNEQFAQALDGRAPEVIARLPFTNGAPGSRSEVAGVLTMSRARPDARGRSGGALQATITVTRPELLFFSRLHALSLPQAQAALAVASAQGHQVELVRGVANGRAEVQRIVIHERPEKRTISLVSSRAPTDAAPGEAVSSPAPMLQRNRE